MSQQLSSVVIPSVIQKKLRRVRWLQALLSLTRAAALGLAALFSTLTVAMMTDWSLTLFDTHVRCLITVVSLLPPAIVLMICGIGPVRRALGWDQAADSVDRHLPVMEERWQTVTSMTSSARQPQTLTGRAMLAQVTSEAVAMNVLVRPVDVVRRKSVRRPLLALGGATFLLTGLFLSDPQQTTVLLQRFWSPLQNISATQLTSLSGDLIVPRGQSVELATQVRGLLRPSAQLTIVPEEKMGRSEVLQLEPDPGQPDVLRCSVEVQESFRYRVQAGDGRSSWHSVTAIDFPSLSEVRMTVIPPQYMNEPTQEKTLIPGRLRAHQGSHLELAMKPDQPLKSMYLVLTVPKDDAAEKQTLTLHPGNDGWYHFETSVIDSFTLSPLLTSLHDLDNRNPRTCRIEMIADQMPAARILNSEEESTVTPDEPLAVRFEAHDDHGITSAEIVVYDMDVPPGEAPKILAVQPIPLGDSAGQRHIQWTAELNLSELKLTDGRSVSYAIRVTDNRVLDGTETTDTATTATEIEHSPDVRSVADSGSHKPAEPAIATRTTAETAPGIVMETAELKSSPAGQGQAGGGQMSDAGQQRESERRLLKISLQLDAIARSEEQLRPDTGQMRDKVIHIDQMLEIAEKRLDAIHTRRVEQHQRAEEFRGLDNLLRDVETYIVELNEQSRRTAVEFIGLQMVEIGSTYVTPARDAVFAAVREPDSGADPYAEEALHHVLSAREMLQALLRKYDRVAQEQELAEKLDEAVKIYTVYVERSQRLLREARQNFDPLRLQREMAVVNVDQTYLDRLAEVTRMRRDILSELAGILADDPRLRSRYLDLIRRRRSSLRSQLAELTGRQDQMLQEVQGWLSVADNQREPYWQQLSDLRLDQAGTLARESRQFADRMEKQMPLILNSQEGTAAAVIQLAQQIAVDARHCEFEVRALRDGTESSDQLPQLSIRASALAAKILTTAAALEQLRFEGQNQNDISEFVELRLVEARALADQADLWSVTAGAVDRREFFALAALDQHQLTIAAELLRNDMLNIEDDLTTQFNPDNPMPPELGELSAALQQKMEAATLTQASATFALSRRQLESGAALQERALNHLDEAAQILDQLRRLTIEALDREIEEDPNIADLVDPTLDEFLAGLEREPDIEAQLGIPNRPRNIRVVQDSLLWTDNGLSMLGESEDAAVARREKLQQQRLTAAMPQERQDSQRPEDPRAPTAAEEQQQQTQADDAQEMLQSQLLNAAQALKDRAKDPALTAEQREKMAELERRIHQSLTAVQQPQQSPKEVWSRIVEADQLQATLEALQQGEDVPDEQWNRLLSTLDDGLGQVGSRTPPEDYRRVIQQYQERIRQLTGP